jgi:hypothetical protein
LEELFVKKHSKLLKKLFNEGKLKIKNANFYQEIGFQIVCRAGKVSEVINN